MDSPLIHLGNFLTWNWKNQRPESTDKTGQGTMALEGDRVRFSLPDDKYSYLAQLADPVEIPYGQDVGYRFSMELTDDYAPAANRRDTLIEVHGVRALHWYIYCRRGELRCYYSMGGDGSVNDDVRLCEPVRGRAVQWDIQMNLRRGTGQDGRLALWYDGVPVLDYTGPVGLDEERGGIFQLGIYCPKKDTNEYPARTVKYSAPVRY